MDWIEYYKWNGAGKGFSWVWKDDFDSLDTDKWVLRDDGGWDKNRGSFSPDNVFTAHGMLVLAIDREGDRVLEEDEYHDEDYG